MPDILGMLTSFFERPALAVFLDVLDILVVSALIYAALSLIKGTRAMQMSIGLALVFVLHQLAKRFGLITMWTVLDPLLTYSVLVIVVIFQNDIRRALMRVGRRPFLRGKSAGRETHVIEEVIKAAAALAQRRIGAIVVFERDAALDEFIEKGTDLDSAVSKELLYGVFIPSYENPMHDGAVIIREGRVWQAGAFLPLSVSSKLDRTLGARHRAAIGISEETDAVVVVVSEERGAISLCFNGNIVRNLDGPSLREALHGLFYKPSRTKAQKTQVEAEPEEAEAAARRGAEDKEKEKEEKRRESRPPSERPRLRDAEHSAEPIPLRAVKADEPSDRIAVTAKPKRTEEKSG